MPSQEDEEGRLNAELGVQAGELDRHLEREVDIVAEVENAFVIGRRILEKGPEPIAGLERRRDQASVAVAGVGDDVVGDDAIRA